MAETTLCSALWIVVCDHWRQPICLLVSWSLLFGKEATRKWSSPQSRIHIFRKKNCHTLIPAGALTFLWNLNNSIRIDQLWRTHKVPEARALGKWVYCPRARHQTCHQDAELKNRHPEHLSRFLGCFCLVIWWSTVLQVACFASWWVQRFLCLTQKTLGKGSNLAIGWNNQLVLPWKKSLHFVFYLHIVQNSTI